MNGSNLAPEVWTLKPKVANMHTRPWANSASRYLGKNCARVEVKVWKRGVAKSMYFEKLHL